MCRGCAGLCRDVRPDGDFDAFLRASAQEGPGRRTRETDGGVQAERALLGEANREPSAETPYSGRSGEGLPMLFTVWVNQHLFLALATGDADPLTEALRATRLLPACAPMAPRRATRRAPPRAG